MTMYFLGAIILVLLIAVGGVLAYRNNQAKVEKGIADLQAAAKSIKGK